MMANPYLKYRQTEVETSDQGRLLLMLYEGGIRFAGRAQRALQENDLEAASNYLTRAQDILAELMSSLNFDAGPVAGGLFRLYEYMYFQLVEANVQKSAEPVEQVERMLLELRDAWKKSLGA